MFFDIYFAVVIAILRFSNEIVVLRNAFSVMKIRFSNSQRICSVGERKLSLFVGGIGLETFCVQKSREDVAEDDTAVHAVCRHSRGFFSFGLFFGRFLLSSFAVQHGATIHFVARCICDTSPL